jgi:hypothetical protein
MASEQKMVTISTIPISKLSIIMNNFVANTITHLNKLSVKGDEKLAEFDKKLNDLDVMTTLLEAKLNSLPEQITSTYPPIQECGLDDIIPVIINNPPPEEDNHEEIKDEGKSEQQRDDNKDQNGNQQENEEQKPKQEEVVEELTPQQELDKFLEEHDYLRDTYKLLKMSIPYAQIEQKAGIKGLDVEEIKALYELAKKANPNIK